MICIISVETSVQYIFVIYIFSISIDTLKHCGINGYLKFNHNNDFQKYKFFLAIKVLTHFFLSGSELNETLNRENNSYTLVLKMVLF